MSQSTRKRTHSATESILYALNDYDRQRRPQTLIDDNRIQRVAIEPVLKSLSVKHLTDLVIPSKLLLLLHLVSDLS